MKIISVVGARPNFMKIAPFIKAIEQHNKENHTIKIQHLLVHTGQHYDDRMSKAFFEALKIPDADINLGIGSGTHGEQVGQTMIEFEKVLIKEKPDWVVVVGDVNATLACTLSAKKEGIKVCHIEAGLRSFDMRMPEEINRIVTDRLSDLLLIPDRLSGENLRNEGVPEDKIKFVGNIMIDTLESNREKAEKLDINDIITENLIDTNRSLSKRSASKGTPLPHHSNTPLQSFALVTLHRPSNVDTKEVLQPLVNFIEGEVTKDMPVIWTVHPRTQKKLKEFGLWEKIENNANIALLHPLGYHDMLKINMEASLLLTDSGGLQGESSVLGTSCLTLRENTEWLVTLVQNGGNSLLVGNNVSDIRKAYINHNSIKRIPSIPDLWDGKTATRCLNAIISAE